MDNLTNKQKKEIYKSTPFINLALGKEGKGSKKVKTYEGIGESFLFHTNYVISSKEYPLLLFASLSAIV
jgi:hypothetical protein